MHPDFLAAKDPSEDSATDLFTVPMNGHPNSSATFNSRQGLHRCWQLRKLGAYHWLTAQCSSTTVLPDGHSKAASSGTLGMEQISIYYANARSLKNKLPELEILLHPCEYDIIAFCEAWLAITVPSALLSFGYYAVIRKDRLERCGGGVLLLVRREIDIVQIHIPEIFTDVEAVLVDLKLRDAMLRLAICYRAPNVSPEISMQHCEFLGFVHCVQ